MSKELKDLTIEDILESFNFEVYSFKEVELLFTKTFREYTKEEVLEQEYLDKDGITILGKDKLRIWRSEGPDDKILFLVLAFYDGTIHIGDTETHGIAEIGSVELA